MYRTDLYWTDGKNQSVEAQTYETALHTLRATWARRGFVGMHDPAQHNEIFSGTVTDQGTGIVVARVDSFESGVKVGKAMADAIWQARYDELRHKLTTELERNRT